MAFNINLFAGALKLGGARTSLFQVNISNPANGAADLQVPFLGRAAQIPAATIAPLDVPYFGRQLRLAGNRTFADWTATIINDEDMQIIRRAFWDFPVFLGRPFSYNRDFRKIFRSRNDDANILRALQAGSEYFTWMHSVIYGGAESRIRSSRLSII